jgi:hypothetical protein
MKNSGGIDRPGVVGSWRAAMRAMKPSKTVGVGRLRRT